MIYSRCLFTPSSAETPEDRTHWTSGLEGVLPEDALKIGREKLIPVLRTVAFLKGQWHFDVQTESNLRRLIEASQFLPAISYTIVHLDLSGQPVNNTQVNASSHAEAFLNGLSSLLGGVTHRGPSNEAPWIIRVIPTPKTNIVRDREKDVLQQVRKWRLQCQQGVFPDRNAAHAAFQVARGVEV